MIVLNINNIRSLCVKNQAWDCFPGVYKKYPINFKTEKIENSLVNKKKATLPVNLAAIGTYTQNLIPPNTPKKPFQIK